MRSNLRRLRHADIRHVMEFIAQEKATTGDTLDDIIDRCRNRLPAMVEYRDWIMVLYLHLEHDPLIRFLNNPKLDDQPDLFFDTLYKTLDNIAHSPDNKFIADFAPACIFEWLKHYDQPCEIHHVRREMLRIYKAKLYTAQAIKTNQDFCRSLFVNEGNECPIKDIAENNPEFAKILRQELKEYLTIKKEDLNSPEDKDIQLSPVIVDYLITSCNQGGVLKLLYEPIRPYFELTYSKKYTFHLVFKQADRATLDYNIYWANEAPAPALQNCSLRYRNILQFKNRLVLADIGKDHPDRLQVGIQHSALTIHEPMLFIKLVSRIYRAPIFGDISIAAEAVSGGRLTHWQNYIAESMDYIFKCEKYITLKNWDELAGFQLNRSANNDKTRQFCLLGILTRLLVDPSYKLGSISGQKGVMQMLLDSELDLLKTLDAEAISMLAVHSVEVAECCLTKRGDITNDLLIDLLLYHPQLFAEYKKNKKNNDRFSTEVLVRMLHSAKGHALDIFFAEIMQDKTLFTRLTYNPTDCQLLYVRLTPAQRTILSNSSIAAKFNNMGDNPIEFALNHFDKLKQTELGKDQLRKVPLLDYFSLLFEEALNIPLLENKVGMRAKQFEQLCAALESNKVSTDPSLVINPLHVAEIFPSLHKFDPHIEASAQFYRILENQEHPSPIRTEDVNFIHILKNIPLIHLYEFLMQLQLSILKHNIVVPNWMISAVQNAIVERKDTFDPEQHSLWHFKWNLIVDYCLEWARPIPKDKEIVIPKLPHFFARIFSPNISGNNLLERFLQVLDARTPDKKQHFPINLFADLLHLNVGEFYAFFLKLHRCNPNAAKWVFTVENRVLPTINKSMPAEDLLRLWLLCIEDFSSKEPTKFYKELYTNLRKLFAGEPELLQTLMRNRAALATLSSHDVYCLMDYSQHPESEPIRNEVIQLVTQCCFLSPNHVRRLIDAHLDDVPMKAAFDAIIKESCKAADVFAFFRLLDIKSSYKEIRTAFYQNENLVRRLLNYCMANVELLRGKMLLSIFSLARKYKDPDLGNLILTKRQAQITVIINQANDTAWHCLVDGLIAQPAYHAILKKHLPSLISRATWPELRYLVMDLDNSEQFKCHLNNARIIPEMIRAGANAEAYIMRLVALVKLPGMEELRRGMLDFPYTTLPSNTVRVLLGTVLTEETKARRDDFFQRNKTLGFADDPIIQGRLSPNQLVEPRRLPVAPAITTGLFRQSPPRQPVENAVLGLAISNPSPAPNDPN